MGKLLKRVYLFAKIVKLIAYFFIYQCIFIAAGQFAAYLFYRFTVDAVPYSLFAQLPNEIARAYINNGVAIGMLVSSLAMIVHLFLFNYVRISKDFLYEVRRDILVLSTLFIASVMLVFNVIAAWLGLENNMESTIEQIMGSSAGIVSVALLAPILEELLFRGAIQGAMMRFFKNPWVGIIVAALLFGIIHGNPIQIFYASCLGIAFGWVYYRTGSLLPAIVGHIVNNSLAVISFMLFGSSGESEVVADSSGDITMVIVGTLFAAVFALVINKRQPKVPSPWHEVRENL